MHCSNHSYVCKEIRTDIFCITGDIIFNAQYPELPPDFIFGEDAEFLPDPSALHVSTTGVFCVPKIFICWKESKVAYSLTDTFAEHIDFFPTLFFPLSCEISTTRFVPKLFKYNFLFFFIAALLEDYFELKKASSLLVKILLLQLKETCWKHFLCFNLIFHACNQFSNVY